MEQTEDPRRIYADIIDHPHHRSETRAHMRMCDRAAQFSAYDALAGFFDMIAEEERVTDAAVELDESALELLDRKLARIAERIGAGERPRVSFTVFRPDRYKSGGEYVVITDTVRRIDPAQRRVELERREGRGGLRAGISIPDIVDIREEDPSDTPGEGPGAD